MNCQRGIVEGNGGESAGRDLPRKSGIQSRVQRVPPGTSQGDYGAYLLKVLQEYRAVNQVSIGFLCQNMEFSLELVGQQIANGPCRTLTEPNHMKCNGFEKNGKDVFSCFCFKYYIKSPEILHKLKQSL